MGEVCRSVREGWGARECHSQCSEGVSLSDAMVVLNIIALPFFCFIFVFGSGSGSRVLSQGGFVSYLLLLSR